MAVAHDAASESHTGTTGSASEASFSWTHAPAGTPRGVLVFVINMDASTATVQGVTYGGQALVAVEGAVAADTAGEQGRCSAFFLGSGIATGNQTVEVTRDNNANVLYAVCVTVTAAGDTRIAPGSVVLLEQNGTLAEQSVDDGSPGADSVRYAAGFSGLGAVPAAGANSTALVSIDIGAQVAGAVRETAAGQGARSVGFSSGTSDDRAFVHLAVSEAPSPPTVTTQAASDVAEESATANGDITATGGENADARGFVYGASSQGAPGNVAPASAGYDAVSSASGSFGTGAYTGALTALVPATTYYVRAWAHNGGGYAYGDEVNFTSLDWPVRLVASTHIAAGGADATTARLMAPAGKDTGDFSVGRIADDTNPLPAVTVGADGYTEVAWCVTVTDVAVADDVYQFRVTRNGTVLDAYDQTPAWTVETEGGGGLSISVAMSHYRRLRGSS